MCHGHRNWLQNVVSGTTWHRDPIWLMCNEPTFVDQYLLKPLYIKIPIHTPKREVWRSDMCVDIFWLSCITIQQHPKRSISKFIMDLSGFWIDWTWSNSMFLGFAVGLLQLGFGGGSKIRPLKHLETEHNDFTFSSLKKSIPLVI